MSSLKNNNENRSQLMSSAFYCNQIGANDHFIVIYGYKYSQRLIAVHKYSHFDEICEAFEEVRLRTCWRFYIAASAVFNHPFFGKVMVAYAERSKQQAEKKIDILI